MKPNTRRGLIRATSGRRLRRRARDRGAALVLAILVLAILTVIGIALMLITSTESRIAANEWSVNRAFYASDAGIRWATAEAGARAAALLARPEIKGVPFGTLTFQLPSHRNAPLSFFAGDPGEDDIQVRIQSPSLVGRRPCRACNVNDDSPLAMYYYGYEVRSTGGENDAFLQYSKSLVADVEIGPYPKRYPF